MNVIPLPLPDTKDGGLNLPVAASLKLAILHGSLLLGASQNLPNESLIGKDSIHAFQATSR